MYTVLFSLIICYKYREVAKHLLRLLSSNKLFTGDPEPKLKDLVILNISEWYDVGLQLNLDEHALDCIEKSDSGFRTQKRKMFTLWLHSDPSPSYWTLARALFRVGENRIATEICTKYGKSLQTYIVCVNTVE